MRREGQRQNPQLVTHKLSLPQCWTLDLRLWRLFLVTAGLFLPGSAFAQIIGSGGWTIQVFGVVQVEPGSNVLTLGVKKEEIRFAVQDLRCTDQRFSKDRFLSETKHRRPSVYIRGPEPILDTLLKERPNKRVLRLNGIFYTDTRVFVLNRLESFREKLDPPGLLQ